LWLSLLKVFSPYPNLFTVYNKYLLRWVRNMMIQVYFMSISLSFAINSALLSAGSSMSEFDGPGAKVALFFIIMLGVVLLRPIALKVMYGMLYEPYGRVEDYQDTSEGKKNGKVKGIVLDISDS